MLSLLFAIILVHSCSSSDENSSSNAESDGFDREALLANTSDNIIIPAFQDLEVELSALKVSNAAFVLAPNETNLTMLSNAWLEAYKTWQHVQMFNLGLAKTTSFDADRGFRTYFNRYPVSKKAIDQFAETGSYDLSQIPTYNAQGFPALDYLLHGIAEGDALPIDKFTTNIHANGYLQYLEDIVLHMAATNTAILNNWQNSYRDVFVENTQNGVNGSFNMLANDFLFFYEKGFRSEKVGIPAGNFSNGPLPENVEAFYKRDVSKILALEALDAIENMFNGRAYNGSSQGESIKTYLSFLDREDISTAIDNQFSEVRASLNGLNDNFYQQILDNNAKMTEAYDVIQAGVPILKVDMRQALDFTVDFTDSDGD